jgi:asparagine synthase (glutamine-hydrolysing)
VDNPLWALPVGLFRQIASDGHRVVLTGEAGDAVCVPESGLPSLIGTGHLAPLARDIWHYWRAHRRRPPFWVRPWLHQRRGRRPEPDIPAWLNPRLADGVRQRARDEAPLPGGWARQELRSPMWPWCALTQDAAWTRVAVEARYPFLDLRLVSFMLSVPSVPWKHDKELMRTAMRGRLPQEILRRAKAPLAADPIDALFRRDGPPPLPAATSPVWEFVDKALFEREWRAGARPRELTRVLSLARWLSR